ncbi:glycerophosphodiester phosphodiesterase family protein [Glutamicibacter sp.]|uniref:glycerophosphodiester phosphodiesterase family protein n=1 Tax=Glutamicibacter sp. TaxID=1931995 RepID=UPI0028BDBD5C|nr:glycerophosphodiester phosphodiesterase family protein [Glutamicibacter sp.]
MLPRIPAAVAASLLAVGLASPVMAAEPSESQLKTNERNGSFDLQAHRGGLAEWTEESIAAFGNALEVGVTTLELDTMLSEDGKIVVWHDDRIQPSKCADTAPVVAGDPEFPYVGQRVADLSFAQLSTLNCGYQKLPGYPEQNVAEGNRIAQLKDVFALVKESKAKKVRFNIETKVEDGRAGGHAMEKLTVAVLDEIQDAGMAQRTTLQSFDWAALNLARDLAADKKAPKLPLVALTSGDKAMGVGQPGSVPELGGIDIDDYDGSLAKAAKAQGYDVISPAFAAVTDQMISEAHDLGLPVIPWTVNSRTDMERLMDMGVDGIITNFPTRLRELMAERGLKLPKSYTQVQN